MPLRISLEKWQVLKSPSLAGAARSARYHGKRMQDALGHAFGDTFPQVMEDDRDLVYFLPMERGVEPCGASSPISEFSEIPRVEVVHLLEGWIRIKRMLADQANTRGIEAMLLNFKLPCPRRNLECYRLYSGEVSERKLVVIWGVETDKNPCVPFEEALSLLLDLPMERMQQMLSRAMAPSNLDAANLSNTLAIRDRMLMEESRKTDFSTFRWVALAVVALIAGGVFWLIDRQQTNVAYDIQARDTQSVPLAADSIDDVNSPIQLDEVKGQVGQGLADIEAVAIEPSEQITLKNEVVDNINAAMEPDVEVVKNEEESTDLLLEAMMNPTVSTTEQ